MHDKLAIFSENQAVTATAVSTNAVMFTGEKGKNEAIEILCQVTEDFATLTSLTLEIQESATEGGSYETIALSPAIAAADLVTGYQFALRVMPQITKPWIKLKYTVGGSNATAGKIYAAVSAKPLAAPYKDGLYIDARNPTGAL